MPIKTEGDLQTKRLGLMKNILMDDLGLNKEDLDEAWEIYKHGQI